MAKYMTQPMQSGILKKVTYYRKQSDHPPHDESGKFTADAISTYCATYGVQPNTVEKGKYQSNQGIPANGVEI